MPTISEPTRNDKLADALDRFRAAMWAIHDIARRAEKVENLPPHYAALAAAMTKLSGMRPHNIVGETEPDDFKALIENLEHVILSVDPLVLAFGEYAKSNAPSKFDTKLFTDQLRGALEGNATYELECAAERRQEEIQTEDADKIGWARARMAEVD